MRVILPSKRLHLPLMDNSQGPTFTVSVDEAGDDGLNCICGEWMILSAVVTLTADKDKDVALVTDTKTAIGWRLKKPLHFRDLSDEGKRLLVTKMAARHTRVKLISVWAHKPSMRDDPAFREKSRLYFYLVRYLLERVSWLCRDAQTRTMRSLGDGTARVVFSTRDDLSHANLQDYFAKLQTMNTRIVWEIIKPDQFVTLRNGKHAGLQMADAAASALYCCEHHIARKVTQEWASILKPTLYRYNGHCKGYGLKVFPSSAEQQLAQGKIAPWAKALMDL